MLAFIGAVVLFLPLFVFLKVIRPEGGEECISILRVSAQTDPKSMKTDADSVIEAFGKNEQVKKVFWTVFVSVAGVVLTKILDPVTAQQIVGMISGMI